MLSLVGLGLGACSSSAPATVTPTSATASFTLKPQSEPYLREGPLEYYLYLPQAYTPEREWPLFVGLHGAGGSPWDCLAMWRDKADRAGYVLMCPALEDARGGWEQDEKKVVLREAIQQVRTECRLQPKIFLAGFSRGAHLVQRYAWAYPTDLSGAAVLSAVTYDSPVATAKDVPFLVVLGDGDHLGGVDDVQHFAEALTRSGFSVELHILPNVGHEVTDEALQLTLQFFERTTHVSSD